MDEWEFAFWSENAQWMHSQMLMIQQTNALGMIGGGSPAPPPRPGR
jgi:hypothetical protein